MKTCLIVGFGGFIGSVCRYLLTLIPIAKKTNFPFTTLLINISGALLIGVIIALAAKYKGMNTDVMTFLRIGLCGGFTTFSAYALEVSNLFGAGKIWAGVAYVVLSLALSLAAIGLGKAFVSLVFRI